jgi:hypothetical protein
MCCTPDHIGRPPGWQARQDREIADTYAGIRGGIIAGESPGPVTRAAMSAMLQLAAPAPGAATRAVSTEGGQGHAIPRNLIDHLFDELAHELARINPGREAPAFNAWAPETLRRDPDRI